MDVTVSGKAREALRAGIIRDDCLTSMEYLGLSYRTLNCLENSKFNIRTLRQLLALDREQILKITNLGTQGLAKIVDCIQRYDELEAIMEETDERKIFKLKRKKKKKNVPWQSKLII